MSHLSYALMWLGALGTYCVTASLLPLVLTMVLVWWLDRNLWLCTIKLEKEE